MSLGPGVVKIRLAAGEGRGPGQIAEIDIQLQELGMVSVG